MKKPFSISIIGAGNVAHHLAHRLFEVGYQINQVFSRRITRARQLAKPLGAIAIKDIRQLQPGADLYIIAIHDDAIDRIAAQMSECLNNPLVVHTSGSVASKVLKPYFKNYGCFYPLQTFSIGKPIDFEVLPLCIHSPQKRNRIKLDQIARSIGPNVFEVNDEQRSILHVAAVIVNNFTNYLYHIGQEITEQADLDFDILKPLILETAQKIQHNDARTVQTGPARRGDEATISRHLLFLQAYPSWFNLYEAMTRSIQKM